MNMLAYSHLLDMDDKWTAWDEMQMHLNDHDIVSELDLFDPWDLVDQTVHRHLQWLDQPDTLRLQRSEVPHRYRITLNCEGFKLKSLKTKLEQVQGQNVLRVIGLEERGNRNSDNFIKKELKRLFMLPKNVMVDKMVSFMTPEGLLVIELPLRIRERSSNQQVRSTSPTKLLLPRVFETKSGKEVRIKFPLPDNIEPDKINVTVKDRDLILRVEDKHVSSDSTTRIHIYDRATLPVDTVWSQLKCEREGDLLVVSAPLSSTSKSKSRNVEVEMEAMLKMEPSLAKKKSKAARSISPTVHRKKEQRDMPSSRSQSRDIDDLNRQIVADARLTPKKKSRSVISESSRSRSRDIPELTRPLKATRSITPTLKPRKKKQRSISRDEPTLHDMVRRRKSTSPWRPVAPKKKKDTDMPVSRSISRDIVDKKKKNVRDISGSRSHSRDISTLHRDIVEGKTSFKKKKKEKKQQSFPLTTMLNWKQPIQNKVDGVSEKKKEKKTLHTPIQTGAWREVPIKNAPMQQMQTMTPLIGKKKKNKKLLETTDDEDVIQPTMRRDDPIQELLAALNTLQVANKKGKKRTDMMIQ